MDYKTYLDFVLSLENKHEPQALQYLFRFLDIKHQGYLDTFTLFYFFKVKTTFLESGDFHLFPDFLKFEPITILSHYVLVLIRHRYFSNRK
jgi:hypothetical protein